MRETIQRLIAVQDHDRTALRLQREADSIPLRKDQLALSLTDHQQVVEAAEETLKKGMAAAHEIEGEVNVLREKIARLQTQQFEVKNNDDYRVLTEEIEANEEAIRSLEDRELEQMEKNENLRAKVEKHKQAFVDQETTIREETAALEMQAEKIAADLASMQENRRTLIADLDPDWLSRYERILSHVGDFALVPIENGTCGGCHMKLPPQAIQDARRAESISSCAYCGRLLYWR